MQLEGFLYRGMELWCGDYLAWPQSFRAMVISANGSSDLLLPSSWSHTEGAPFARCAVEEEGSRLFTHPRIVLPTHALPLFHREMIPDWMPEPVVSGGYLEGNTVVMPDGTLGLLMRCRVCDIKNRLYTLEHACLFTLDGNPTPALNNVGALQWRGFISMPGGGNKFVVRCAGCCATVAVGWVRTMTAGTSRIVKQTPVPLPTRGAGMTRSLAFI